MGSRISIEVPFIASPSSVFFTTRYSHPLARNSLRIFVSASTRRPRKSTSTRLCARASFCFRPAMAVSFSRRSTVILLGGSLGVGHERRRVDLDPGPHGGRYGDRAHVRALRRRRLELDD